MTVDDGGQVVARDYTYDYHWKGDTPSERIEQLKADLERARSIAVALEQENAELRRMLRKERRIARFRRASLMSWCR